MRPRWKGKGSEAKAVADPMSQIVSQIKSSLLQSDSHGLISTCCVLIEANAEQTDLLNRACFGRPIATAEQDKQWFQLGMEEAFYLCHTLKCLKVKDEDGCIMSEDALWQRVISIREAFPIYYKAYSHLRTKNWVVKAGSQYGVDYVAYRHHPALVHSDYAVLVMSDKEGEANRRLRVWSDFQCTLRVCGSVAKTLLLLHVNDCESALSPSCLEGYTVEEFTVARWNPEQCREGQTAPSEDRSK